MKEILKLAKSSWKLIPGLFAIYYNLWVPLEIPRWLLFGIMEAVCISIIVFFYQQASLKRKSWAYLRKRGIICFSVFLVLLAIYIAAFEMQNIYSSKYDTSILMPFWKKGNLLYMINKSGSINNAILSYGPEEVRNAINDEKMSMGLTIIIFIANYTSVFAFLTLGFCYFTVKNGKK